MRSASASTGVIALSASSSSVGWILTASLFLQALCEKIKVVDDRLGALGLLTRPLDAGLVLEMLRSVIDPKLGVNIVDLGLPPTTPRCTRCSSGS
ncbi:MAG TPA: hypothetical protein VIJ66_06400 [Solirubrobacteraceae bacterium]